MAVPSIDIAYDTGLKQLFENSRRRIYLKNQLIHYQGDILSDVYMVQSGYVKAYAILDSGETRTILLFSRGDIFPLAFSLAPDGRHSQVHYFYQSLTDVRLQVIPSDKLRQRILSKPDLAGVFMDHLSASNETVMRQLEIMKNKKAIDKMLLSLPYLIDKSGKEIKPGVYELQLKLSHQEIADLTGLARETVTILIKELEQMGILDQRSGAWRINTAKLQQAEYSPASLAGIAAD